MSSLEVYLRDSGLDKALLHMVKLRASQINGCAYCINMHWKDARAVGESEQRLYGLDAWRGAPYYTDRERAALEWTEALTNVTDGHVPDAAFDAVRGHFGGLRPVAIRSHFFEFITEGGTSILAHELEPNRIYSVAITTGGGLYRYRLADRVRVTGFAGRTPSLEFLGKEDHVSDLCGEKLDAEFIARTLENVLNRCNLRPNVATLAPNVDHYVLYIQSDQAVPADLAEVLDEQLRAALHYGYCRTLGQLGAVRVFCVRGDANCQFLTAAHARGRRLGNIKPGCLSRDVFPSDFDGEYLTARRPAEVTALPAQNED